MNLRGLELRRLGGALGLAAAKWRRSTAMDRARRTVVIVGVVLLGAFTSYYQVEPDEVGVLTRFGHYSGTSGPGPHFQIPFGIERVQQVPVQRARRRHEPRRESDFVRYLGSATRTR